MIDLLPTVLSADLEVALRAWNHELEADLLVFGLPLRRGKMGSAARKVRRVAYDLAGAVGLPLVFVNEAETTDEATSLFPGRDKDAIAAALILKRFLADGPLEALKGQGDSSR
jgi:RNase H-fold protein (predicted Holliday junction resolvase)